MPTARRTTSTRLLTASPVAGGTVRTIRVATYRRASTDEDNQPYSLELQQTKLASYIASQDAMELVCDYEEYASAKDVEGRPQLLRLLEEAASGKFDAVLVYKVDRFSRRLADLLATVDFLDRYNVTFASATEPIDTTTSLGKMVLQMLGSFAEFERGLIVERVTRGIEAKLARGLPLAVVGYGLTKSDAGIVEADLATFGVVQRIFREYTQDRLGTKTIAMRLQADSLPTPGHRPWSAAAVARVLRNRTFIGELPFRDGWVPGAHEPLIDADIFAAAQGQADERAKPRAAARAKSNFLLSGTVVCGHCGGAYVGNTGTSKNKTKVRYYSCVTSRRYGKAACAAPALPADDLEAVVADALLNTYGDTELFESAVSAHLAAQEASIEPMEAELVALRTSTQAKERIKRKYEADYEGGTLDARLYSSRTAELVTEIEASRTRIAALELTMAAAEVAPVPTEEDREAMRNVLAHSLHAGPIPVRKALFAALVKRLEVHAVDDVRPTFLLGGPELPEGTLPGETTGSRAEVASNGSVFACHSPGWSQGDSNP